MGDRQHAIALYNEGVTATLASLTPAVARHTSPTHPADL